MDQATLIAEAERLEAAYKFEAARANYEAAAAAAPSAPLLLKLAQLTELTGGPEAARAVYGRALALEPGSFAAATKRAGTFLESDGAQAAKLLEEFLPNAAGPSRVEVLGQLATFREWAARQARGLPPSHVLDLAQFPFAYAQDDLRRFVQGAAALMSDMPGDPRARALLGYARLLEGDIAEANRLFRTGAAASASIAYGEPAAAGPALPEVVGAWPRDPCFFVSCDQRYFQAFLLPLLKSLARFVPDQRVHIHAMGPLADHAAIARHLLPLRVTLTHEIPDAYIAAHAIRPTTYYGAARFVRFAEALAVNDGPLWMSDADCLIARDPKALFSRAGDLALRIRPGRIEPEHQISGCLVMGAPAARPYFRHVADIISEALPRAFWGLDQAALYAAYLLLKSRGEMPEITLLGPAEAGVKADADDGVFWFTAGARKKRLFAKPLPANPTSYERLFREVS